ncbi:uncharacterized protein BDR25DRAFT_344331 [Lindgomyces ingoldianus]|uniref:Uncharacterized protein n=1 Tax=Lindgomyces ingoldianus TaxID=673940 RepID=A0ACB6QN47_9PLEO|nr:uncharacterized protein BDR25DRAFT_344331 [Lindgomyces ingoldianus]KAF2468326.1 hypothetical protein BDR25DRAFT_344331 [Lindgomyces ingoldianus]
MRIQWSHVLLMAASIGMPLRTSAAPCADGKCSRRALILRDADPGIPVILPKPVVPKPVVPKPGVPVAPKPITPGVPKPQEPPHPGGGKVSVKEDPAAVSDDNPCGVVAARSLDKRADRVPDDAADWKQVYLWLHKESGVDRSKIVFWAGQDFQTKAADFAKANGYNYYWGIFNKKFADAFGGVAMQLDKDVNIACSKALVLYSKDPLVFNHDNAPTGSFWTEHELPNMWRAGTITKLKDDAKTPADKAGVIPTPARPGTGQAGSC